MGFQFSDNIWEKISLLWSKEDGKKTDEPDYSDKEVRDYMELWFKVRRAIKQKKEHSYDVQQAWKSVDVQTRLSSSPIFITLLKYAAILIFIISLAILLIPGRDQVKSVQTVANIDPFPSGTRRAELILANGERVVLDANSNLHEMDLAEMSFINDEKSGELSYEGILNGADSYDIAYHTLQIPEGGEYSLQLPDGSKVWLNSETSIRFPVQFSEHKREVYLSGEAYFRVTKNDLAPFNVCVKGGSITVLGTNFNVSAYEDDMVWETTLVEGRVQVGVGAKEFLMKPSEQYSLNRRSGEGVLKIVDTELYTSWIDGKLYFNAYSFEKIVKKLERWYDFTMTYQDEEIKDMHFSGTINKHRPLSEILRFLEKTTDIHFEISGKSITVSKIKKG